MPKHPATSVDLRVPAGRTIEASKARQQFRDLIDDAVQHGTRLTVTRSGKPVAAVVPLRDLERLQGLDAALDLELAASTTEPARETMPFEAFHAITAKAAAAETAAPAPAIGSAAGRGEIPMALVVPAAAMLVQLVQRLMSGIVAEGAQRTAERVSHGGAPQDPAEIVRVVAESMDEAMANPEQLRQLEHRLTDPVAPVG